MAKCECCGQNIPEPIPLCLCGHPLASHNDNGGRNKKAYCTAWVMRYSTKSMVQCECKDATPADEGEMADG